MYNLAKLLTEEPKKLERLIILFIKLLITLCIGCTLFGFDISISSFIKDPIPNELTITQLIYFFIALIFTWFIVWGTFADLIVGECIIRLFSLLGNKKKIFEDILSSLKIAKKQYGNLMPQKNIILFNKWINNFNAEDNDIQESRTRFRQYYIVSVTTYLFLIYFTTLILPSFLLWISGFFILNIFVSTVVLHIVNNYLNENLEEIRNKINQLAYSQFVLKALNQISFIQNNFQKEGRWDRIKLLRKNEMEWLPKTMRITPLYSWNDSLAKEKLRLELKRLESKKNEGVKRPEDFYSIVVCNIKPDDEIIKLVEKQSWLAYLYCEDEKQIFKHIELLLFKITKGNYYIS